MGQTAIPATHASVHELAVALGLDEAAYARAVELARLEPDAPGWRRYVDRFLAGLGSLMVIAGVTAFFALNWAGLHHFAKFALLEAGIVAAVLLAWRLRMYSNAGGAALFGGAFLIGILFAVFGQVYQTGADPYGLFLTWAVLLLPWALVARQSALWLLVQVLFNLALIMYWTQVLYPPSGWWQLSQLLGPLVWLGMTVVDSRLASWLFALNAAAIVLWEFAAARGISWLQGRTAPRIIALIALGAVVAPTLLLIFGASAGTRVNITLISPVLFAAATAACLWHYQFRKPDLFMLTTALFGAILVIMAFAVRYLLDAFQSLLLLALLLVGLIAVAAWWLKGVAQRWAATA